MTNISSLAATLLFGLSILSGCNNANSTKPTGDKEVTAAQSGT